MTAIKICGLTRREDLNWVIHHEIDFAGFIFVPKSPRFLSPEKAHPIFSSLNSGKTRLVAVFQNPSQEWVREVLSFYPFDFLQFHGTESVEFCESFHHPYFKVFTENEIPQIPSYPTPYILLDAAQGAQRGGTGQEMDWPNLNLAGTENRKLFVAGGLHADNVQRCIHLLHPYGVDVSSGVEDSPGVKSFVKMENLTQKVRSLS